MALSIAGSDSGGGAGIQADLKTFSANAVYGTTAITCVTAQNPDGVAGVEALPTGIVAAQMQQVAEFFDLRAVKTGMLFNVDIILAVADFLRLHSEVPVVVDPVMVATSGAVLLEESAIDAMTRELLPLATLITPNLDEAAVLLGRKPETSLEMEQAALELAQRFNTAVLLKGGHLSGSLLTDWLALPNGNKRGFNQQRLPDINTHGSGCTLASAIAAQLALGQPLETAVELGLGYLKSAMERPVWLNGTAWIGH